MEKIISFLKEYEEICKKYGLYIDACGCCDSPYLCSGPDVHDIKYIECIYFDESENKLRFDYWNGDKLKYGISIERLEELVKENKDSNG